MPISDKQLAANRRNAQSSTGPRTQEGKQIAARNAVSHGIFARDIVASRVESVDDFEALRNALVDDLQPQGALEELLVEQIATLYWRQRRVLRAEAGAIDHSLVEATDRASRDRARDLVTRLQTVAGLGGSRRLYGGAVAHGLRDSMDDSAEGQEFLLAGLHDAIASLDSETPLRASMRATLIDLVGSHSDLGRLLVALDDSLDDAPSTDLTPHLPAIRAALDTCIVEAEDRLALLRRRDERDLPRLTARLSLPPAPEADKILRYDKVLGNALARTLAELHRLQAARRATPGGPDGSA